MSCYNILLSREVVMLHLLSNTGGDDSGGSIGARNLTNEERGFGVAISSWQSDN